MSKKPKIEVRNITDLQPDPNNINKHTVRGHTIVENSIRKRGVGRGILAAGKADVPVILAGNLTHEKARDAGIEEVVFVHTTGNQLVVNVRDDLDPESADAIALAIEDNESQRLSYAPDLDLVAQLAAADTGVLAELRKQDKIFDGMIEGMGIKGEMVDAEPQIDRAEELLEKWQVKSGDLWQIGEHRLLCGDCTRVENANILFGNKHAQMGLTSPPYAIGKEYEEDVTFDEHIKLLEGLADRSLEIIEPGGFFFVNFGEIAARSHASPLTGSKRQCIYLISKDYWRIFHEERRMDLYAQRIWYKPFGRLQQPFWSYHTSIPHQQEWEHIWTWRLPGGDGDKVHDWDISVHAVWDTRNEATEDKPLTRHSAAFPVSLPERALKAHTDKGALIWEPFTGSGTTMLVSQNLGRICYGTELNPKYCAVALERMATAFPDLEIRRISGETVENAA